MTEIPVIFKHKSDIPILNDIVSLGPTPPSIFSSAGQFGFAVPMPYNLVVEKGGCKYVGEGFESELKQVRGDCVLPLGIEIFIPPGVALFNYCSNLLGSKEFIVDRSSHPTHWYTPKIIVGLPPGEYRSKGVYLRILPILDLDYQFIYKEEKDEGK